VSADPSSPPPSDYVVRPFSPADAEGISRCVRQVYGDSYTIHPELYHSEQIIACNEAGRLVSVVGVARDEIIGHYAIERPRLEPIGETGEAMVMPEYRHHHLMERMHEEVIAEARRLGLAGLFGNAVTNHPFTQRMYTHFDAHPCGVSLGLTPRSFRNIAEPLTQRMSCLLYFQYLRKPQTVRVHVPELHRPIVSRLYGQYGVTIEFGPAEPPTGKGEMEVDPHPDGQTVQVRITRVGANSAEDFRSALRAWRAEGKLEALYLDLPLAHPATPVLCDAAEREGFFFSGIGPFFASAGDALRLQRLEVPLDISQLVVEAPLARELLAYVESERVRIGRAMIGG
jgi:GNAT superfamily N-acetyltransferase